MTTDATETETFPELRKAIGKARGANAPHSVKITAATILDLLDANRETEALGLVRLLARDEPR